MFIVTCIRIRTNDADGTAPTSIAGVAAFERRLDAEDHGKEFVAASKVSGTKTYIISETELQGPKRTDNPKTCAHDWVDVSAPGQYGSMACVRCGDC
jgi:hypothetical protein